LESISFFPFSPFFSLNAFTTLMTKFLTMIRCYGFISGYHFFSSSIHTRPVLILVLLGSGRSRQGSSLLLFHTFYLGYPFILHLHDKEHAYQISTGASHSLFIIYL